nr:PBP1A family penicillin-binding protein [bacterium]
MRPLGQLVLAWLKAMLRGIKSKKFKMALGIFLGSLLIILLTLPYMLGINPFAHISEEDLINRQQSMRVYDRYGNLAAMRSGVEERVRIPLSDIPQDVINAFLSSEDARFYQHIGVDVWRIGGAMIANLKSGSRGQGASTITQQLVKNSLLSTEKTYTRKLKEAILALMLERQYSKDDILSMYLNSSYFGRRAYGIEAAARAWFSKPASELTLSEGAMLVGILPAPNRYSPDKDQGTALKRRNRVIKTMLEKGKITQDEADAAIAQSLSVSPYTQVDEHYGYYIDEVLREAIQVLGISAEELLSGGYQIDTWLDPGMQSALENAVEQDANFPADRDGEPVQTAAVLADPQTGGIYAIVGGREYTVQRGLNRATQMKRQPGSAIKPILVYAPAIEYANYSPAHFVLDEEEDFAGYKPTNSGGTTSGWVTLRQSLAKSLNIPAVRVLSDIGINTGKMYASRVGISFESDDDHLALALGGFKKGVSPVQMLGAYMPFANGGRYIKPWLVRTITDAQGNVVYTCNHTGETVLSRETAYLMTDMLMDVTSTGTARVFGELGVAAAGKTGTVDYQGDGNKDAWMAAYTQKLCGVVWMGYDSGKALPEGAVGGNHPARLLAQLFARFGGSAVQGATPPGIVRVPLDKQAFNQHRWQIADDNQPAKDIIMEVFRMESAPGRPTESD